MGKTFHFMLTAIGTYLAESLPETPTGTHEYENFTFRCFGGVPLTFLYDYDQLVEAVPDPGTAVHDWLDIDSSQMAWAGTIRGLGGYIPQNERMVATTFGIVIDGEDVNPTCTCVVGAFETGTVEGTGNGVFINGSFIYGNVNSPTQDDTDPDYVSDLMQVRSLWLEMDSTTTHNTIFCSGPSQGYLNGEFGNNALGDWPTSSEPATPLDCQWAEGRTFYGAAMSGAVVSHWAQFPSDATEAALTTLSEIETHIAMKVRSAGTLGDMRCYVTLNSTDEDVTVRRRINSANGTAVIVIQPEEAGWFEDTTHNDAVVSGDLVNYSITEAGIATGGNTFFQWFLSDFAATGTTVDISCNRRVGVNTYAQYFLDVTGDSITEERYIGINGGWQYNVALTAYNIYQEIEVPFATTFSRLRAYVGYFNGDDFTIGTFVNGEHGNQSLAINATGWFEDTTNTDDLGGCFRRICYYMVAEDGLEGIAKVDHIDMTYTAGVEADCDPEEPCDLVCPGAISFTGLKHRALKMCGEDWATPIYWTDAEMGRYVNDAYTRICRETKALEYIEAVQLTEDSAAGTLSRFVGPIFRATWDDRKIENVTKWELDRSVHDWETETGLVRSYVTTLHDDKAVSTYPTWDGSTYNAEEHFYNDGQFTYAEWVNATQYAVDDRVTVTSAAGVKKAYVSLTSHTSATATSKPGSGSAWQTDWAPLSLMVWCVKNPDELGGAVGCDEPETSPWSHIAIAYLAASLALRKHGEMRNVALADAYEDIAGDYIQMMKGIVANRTPERTIGMAARGYSSPRFVRPIPLVEE